MFGTSVLFLGVGRGRQPGCHRMREAAGSWAGVRLGTARLGPPRPLPPNVRPHEFAARRQLCTRSAGEASPPQRTPPRGLRQGRGLGLDGATLRGVSGKRLAVYRAPEDLGLWTKASWTNGPVMLFRFVFLTGWTDTTVCPLTHLTLSSVPGQFKNGVELGRSRCAPCGAPCMR